MASDPTDTRRNDPAWPWILAALALVALRVPHLRGPIVDPHAWRQCDTLHTSMDFFRRGLDVLHPAVCWLGAHRTLVLNFPLSESLSALLYRAFGPDPMWDRLVSLFFCLVAAGYVYGTTRFLAGERAGRLSLLAFLALPLSQYFSRVPHIEFGVIAFVNGTFYHSLRAFEERSARHALLGALCGVFAGLIKGPYLATVALPLAVIVSRRPSPLRLLAAAVPFLAAVAAFLVWREHVDKVNANVPDWFFLPDFYKEVNPIWRYVGTWHERTVAANWIHIARRLVYELATPVGVLIALAAPWRRRPAGEAPPANAWADPRWVAIAWYLNGLVHVAVFFRLNWWHNYYQMPFIAPTAMLIGLGADHAWSRLPSFGRVSTGGVLFAVFLLGCLLPPRGGHYDRVDWLRIQAGRVIESQVPRGQLVVAADFNTLPPTDPRLLYRADREGWPMRAHEITPERIARLRPFGAAWVVVLTDPAHPGVVPPAFLEPARVATVPVLHQGRHLGDVHVFDLGRLSAPATAGGH